MNKKNQAGFLQVVLLLFIIIGLVTGAYLVQTKTSLVSKAVSVTSNISEISGQLEGQVGVDSIVSDARELWLPQVKPTPQISPVPSISASPITSTPTPVFSGKASLSMDPAEGTFDKGCSFPVKINVDTGGMQTDGVDVVLFYDPAKLMVTSIESGSIYQNYLGNITNQNDGKVIVTSLASITEPYAGAGTIATINFKVASTASPGVTAIKFDFDPSEKTKTVDSNIVVRGLKTDALNFVVDGSYNIGTNSCNKV